MLEEDGFRQACLHPSHAQVDGHESFESFRVNIVSRRPADSLSTLAISAKPSCGFEEAGGGSNASAARRTAGASACASPPLPQSALDGGPGAPFRAGRRAAPPPRPRCRLGGGGGGQRGRLGP